MEDFKSLPCYYSVLGVSQGASFDDIRRAYRRLAMQWHPDRWTRTPSLLGEAKRKFQQIQEAYTVLSNQSKRTLYDAGLYDPEEEDDEGFSDFVQELVNLMGQVKEEEKNYSMEDLQTMFNEMVQDFDPQPWFYDTSSVLEDPGCVKSAGFDAKPLGETSQMPLPGLQMFGKSTYCN